MEHSWIIGAVRNNGIGIAGIAGGDASPNTSTNPLGNTRGVSLYSLRCSGIGGDIASLTAAITQGITPSGSGFGVQVINVSLNAEIKPEERVYFKHAAAMDALRQAHQNKVTIVASAGNEELSTNGLGGSDTTFPAHAKDAWTLTVGGTDENGHHFVGIPGIGGYSAAHPFVDVAAPANRARTVNPAFNTVYSLSSASQTSYAVFGQTSAAAAHATGVVALMMSYYNNPALPAEHLQPEDVENLLKIHATDITAFPALNGEDDYTGAGLINATAVIEGLRNNRLYHSPPASAADPSAIEITAVPGGLQDYYMEGGGYLPGIYNAQAYRIRVYASGDYNPNYAVVKRWGLNASSSFLGAPEPFVGTPFGGGPANVATPSQMVNLEPAVTVFGPAGKSAVILEGYAYYVNSFRPLLPGSPNQPSVLSPNVQTVPVSAQWMPFNPSTNPNGNARSMRYASYAFNIGMSSPRASVSGGASDAGLLTQPVAYPNPVTDRVTLAFSISNDDASTAEVQITTVAGRVVRNEKCTIDQRGGAATVALSLSELPVGTYLYRITTNTTVQQGRFTKSE